MPPLRHLVLALATLALATLAGLVATALPLAAAPAERRIALVIGNGAYAAGPIPTAANDAGLVAQTLQAAGFDVVGARDLDEESLRRTLRDFTDKAAAAGPDAVAFLYLSGYGLQLENEAYFAPVDARIETASDVPLRTLRVSDYVKRLAALPLKARFVVLDAARTAPFRLTGDPLAGGLPLVEAEPGSLIATNAAPGTVGPAETGPYGSYALALVEMIRDGGLTPAALFERVRLRVAEATSGAEVPWSASRIDAPFVFLEREAGAPSLAGFEVPQKPLGEIGAREAYAACLGRDTLAGYEEFVGAYPRDPLAKRVRAIIAARREALTWRRSALADTPEAYWSYLGRYPRGPHAWDARRRLSALAAAVAPPPDYRVLAYDLAPPPPDEVIYVERPALVLDDPVYALPPPPVAFLPPRPTVLVELARPRPPRGLYPAGAGLRSGADLRRGAPSVVPPPNPVLFQNLHVTNVTVVNEHAPSRRNPECPASRRWPAVARRGARSRRVPGRPAARHRPEGGAPAGPARGAGPDPAHPRTGGRTASRAAALRPSLPGQIPLQAPAGPHPNPAQALPGTGGAPLPAIAPGPARCPAAPNAGWPTRSARADSRPGPATPSHCRQKEGQGPRRNRAGRRATRAPRPPAAGRTARCRPRRPRDRLPPRRAAGSPAPGRRPPHDTDARRAADAAGARSGTAPGVAPAGGPAAPHGRPRPRHAAG